jgi:hypothetical protein
MTQGGSWLMAHGLALTTGDLKVRPTPARTVGWVLRPGCSDPHSGLDAAITKY